MLFSSSLALQGLPAVADEVHRCHDRPATLVGTEDDDTLNGTNNKDVIVGLGGNDTLNGLDDTDLICGGDGSDVIFGGPGFHDELVGEAGDDHLIGNAGEFDEASYLSSPNPVFVDLLIGRAEGVGIDTLVDIQRVVGSPYSDDLIGDQFKNYLLALGGNDRVDGAAGDDHLSGAAGEDVLVGGNGDDSLSGDEWRAEQGPDSMDGGQGSDSVGYGAEDAGTIEANLTKDRVIHENGALDEVVDVENVYAENGPSVLVGDEGPNRLMTSGYRGSTVLGRGGNDYLEGSWGSGTLKGGRGADAIDVDIHWNGIAGNDTVAGGPGRDRIITGLGNKKIDGGKGKDTVDFSWLESVHVDLVRGTATGQAFPYEPHVTLAKVENVIGTGRYGELGPDILVGDSNANKLIGLNGNDRIFGGEGDDLLRGGSGTDFIDGGNGYDACGSGEETHNCEATAPPYSGTLQNTPRTP